MGFADLLRNGVAMIDGMTADLQGTVQHQAWQSDGGIGLDSLAAAVPRQCVINYTQKHRAQSDGRTANVIATLIFPRPVLISTKDLFTLPNGTTAPILTSPNSPLDPATNAGYFAKVELGEIS